MPCPSQWTVISRRCPQAYPSRGLPTPPWEVLQYSLNPNSDVDTPGNLERAGERQKQGNLSYLNFPEISWYLAHCRHLPPRSSLWWGIGALGISDLPHRDHCSKSPLFELWAASWERGHQLHADRREVDNSPCAWGGTDWLPNCVRAFLPHSHQAQAYGKKWGSLASSSIKKRIMNRSQGTQTNSET